jgi:hypothetical protein
MAGLSNCEAHSRRMQKNVEVFIPLKLKPDALDDICTQARLSIFI